MQCSFQLQFRQKLIIIIIPVWCVSRLQGLLTPRSSFAGNASKKVLSVSSRKAKVAAETLASVPTDRDLARPIVIELQQLLCVCVCVCLCVCVCVCDSVCVCV